MSPLDPVKNWTMKRKLVVINAMREGKITRDEVKTAHGFSDDELDEMIENLNALGIESLMATRASINRRQMVEIYGGESK